MEVMPWNHPNTVLEPSEIPMKASNEKAEQKNKEM
jgi:hypothetical protein